jgi:hypothetical protein
MPTLSILPAASLHHHCLGACRHRGEQVDRRCAPGGLLCTLRRGLAMMRGCTGCSLGHQLHILLS